MAAARADGCGWRPDGLAEHAADCGQAWRISMNRGRQREDKVRAAAIDDTERASIDLGLSLSVYGKDADGKLVEIGAPEPAWYGFSLSETWPTEQ
jgi:hypothetical protein